MEAITARGVCFGVKRNSIIIAVVGVLGLLTLWSFAPSTSIDPVPPGAQVAPHEAYNPVAAGERLPDGFRQLLPRDGIRPIYDPQFTSGADVDWATGTQVIGVAAAGEAKAEPAAASAGRAGFRVVADRVTDQGGAEIVQRRHDDLADFAGRDLSGWDG